MLGQDWQQILIKHGSYYIRCHLCHVTLAQNKHGDKLKDTSDSSFSQRTTSSNHPVNNNCLDSSEDETSCNAEDMGALNVDIETNASEKSTIDELKKHQAAQDLPKDCTEWKQTQITSLGGKLPVNLKGVGTPKKVKMNLLNV